jgi:hypothetical protein
MCLAQKIAGIFPLSLNLSLIWREVTSFLDGLLEFICILFIVPKANLGGETGYGEKMVGGIRLERTTFAMSTQCSNQLS